MSHTEREIIDDLFEKVGSSAIGITLYTDSYKDDPKALMELAELIVLDKPIYLLVKRGSIIPEKLRAISDSVIFYDDGDDMQGATESLLATARERGHLT